jgi:hypothetical protein
MKLADEEELLAIAGRRFCHQKSRGCYSSETAECVLMGMSQLAEV